MNVCIFNGNLFVFLFDVLLSSELTMGLSCESDLLSGYFLLLFWWTLISVFVRIFLIVIEEALKSLNELSFLFFHFFFIGVSREVDIFSLFVFLI